MHKPMMGLTARAAQPPDGRASALRRLWPCLAAALAVSAALASGEPALRRTSLHKARARSAERSRMLEECERRAGRAFCLAWLGLPAGARPAAAPPLQSSPAAAPEALRDAPASTGAARPALPSAGTPGASAGGSPAAAGAASGGRAGGAEGDRAPRRAGDTPGAPAASPAEPPAEAAACLPSGSDPALLARWEGLGRDRVPVARGDFSGPSHVYPLDRLVFPNGAAFRAMPFSGVLYAGTSLRSPALWGDLCDGYPVRFTDEAGRPGGYDVPASANPKLCAFLASAGGPSRIYPAGRILQLKVLVPPGVSTVHAWASNHGFARRLWGFTETDDPAEVGRRIEAYRHNASGWCADASAMAHSGCSVTIEGDRSRPRWIYYHLVLYPDAEGQDNRIELGELMFAYAPRDPALLDGWRGRCLGSLRH